MGGVTGLVFSVLILFVFFGLEEKNSLSNFWRLSFDTGPTGWQTRERFHALQAGSTRVRCCVNVHKDGEVLSVGLALFFSSPFSSILLVLVSAGSLV